MVSFSCEVCNDTLVKKKLTGHFRQCPQAYFTCIDCNTTFEGNGFQAHTQCISEAEKYQKALYRPKGGKTEVKEEKEKEKKDEKKVKKVKREEVKEKKVKKEEVKKTEKTKQDLVAGSSESLGRIIKKLSKTRNTDRKALLKQLKVKQNSSGEYILEI